MKRFALVSLLLLAACGEEEILHGLEERQANQCLVALDEAGIAARKVKEDGADGGWTVTVGEENAQRAQRVLSERELPRPREPGFADVFGKGSMVPTPTEERALYLTGLAGELSRSVEAIDGVVEARVHLTIPPADPLQPDATPPARAAVLVKCRNGAKPQVEKLVGGIQQLVAGAVEGVKAADVSVVLAEGAAAPKADDFLPPPSGLRPQSLALLGGAIACFLLAVGVLVVGLRGKKSPRVASAS